MPRLGHTPNRGGLRHGHAFHGPRELCVHRRSLSLWAGDSLIPALVIGARPFFVHASLRVAVLARHLLELPLRVEQARRLLTCRRLRRVGLGAVSSVVARLTASWDWAGLFDPLFRQIHAALRRQH